LSTSSGLGAEEGSQATVGAGREMHGQGPRLAGHAEGVVLLGDPHREPGRVNAALRGEADQAPGPLTARRRRHDHHRVVQVTGQVLELGLRRHAGTISEWRRSAGW
jgi:hypothetical protein